jgi:GT2 family glycosyltransferase
MMAAAAALDRARDLAMPAISIVLPVFDRRNVGWRSLASALAQDFPHDDYEVIVVVGRDGASLDVDPLARALLAGCDRVVRTDLDTGDVASEAALYAAGVAEARGDWVMFMEGHTALEADCCRTIDAYVRAHPHATMAWAPRFNHDTTPLGRLVTLHNLRHERRAATAGTFSLGANSIIRRDALARFGGFDPRYQRFAETAILRRARAAGVAIGRIDRPLATHFNDMDVAHWRALVMQMGEAKHAYYAMLRARGDDLRGQVRHPAYRLAFRPMWARVLRPLFRFGGATMLRVALAARPLSERLASTLYVPAVGFTDLAGYCRARAAAVEAERTRHAVSSARAASSGRAATLRYSEQSDARDNDR